MMTSVALYTLLSLLCRPIFIITSTVPFLFRHDNPLPQSSLGLLKDLNWGFYCLGVLIWFSLWKKWNYWYLHWGKSIEYWVNQFWLWFQPRATANTCRDKTLHSIDKEDIVNKREGKRGGQKARPRICGGFQVVLVRGRSGSGQLEVLEDPLISWTFLDQSLQ